jgi:uncharacterized protein YndB with AHSA1/START domain
VKIEQTTAINAPPARVWAALVDIEDWPAWTASIEKAERLDSGEFKLGSQVRIKQPKLPALAWTVTEFEPGSYFAWHASSRGVSTTAGHRVVPSAEGCTVTLTISQAGPMSWLASLLFKKMSREYVDMEAHGLKRFCETA